MPDIPTPAAQISLSGQTVTRGHIAYDYGNRVQWKITREGAEVATPDARVQTSYTLAETTAGAYEIVLETWRHDGYQSGSKGQYIPISNKVTVKVG